MNRKRLYQFLIVFILFAFCLVPTKVFASTPYVTQTVDRYGEMIETQSAYEPVKSVKTIEIAGQNVNICTKAQDLFIDEDDYLYLVDTDNSRIIIMDTNFQYINHFGEGVLDVNGDPTGQGRLIKPEGIFVRDEYIYIADYGADNDNQSGKISVYTYDKVTNTVTWLKDLGKPTSTLLEVDGFLFRPQKIAVDKNHTMYIVCKGSSNGILLVNSENRFLNFFAPNQTDGTIWDTIQYFLYGTNEKANLKKKIPPAPTNVMLDDSGYIYTVTTTVVQNNIGDTLKKVNIGGVNMYPTDMTVAGSFIDSWSSDYKTIYSLTSNGFIYEYDIEGTLLFKFAGPTAGDEQLGLFNSASSIAVDSKGNLYVVDPNANTIQVFKKTLFVEKVHDALVLYMSGQYVQSKDLWEEVLRYNSMFDLAHKAIGLSYYLEGDYTQAMEKFEIAYAKEEYSDAFWEVRNLWLMNNLGTALFAVLGLIVVYIVIKKLAKKYGWFVKVKEKLRAFAKRDRIAGILVMKKFITNPADAVYEVRTDKRVKWYNGLIWLFLIFVVYVLHITCTGFLFNNIVLEKTIILKETLKIILPILLFVVANYLISSLMGGDGTMRQIFINTLGSLTPVILLLPFIVLISNFLTFNESFIYTFGLIGMLLWTVVLLVYVIKETHNYTMKQTITNFILTLLMMFIIIIVFILLYLIIAQVVGFVVDITKEVIF